MLNFVVMGEVPGTSIIISFSSWVFATLICMMAVMIYKYAKKHKFSRAIERTKLALIDQITL